LTSNRRHVASGLIATFVEAPIELQKTITIPPDHYSLCARNDPPVPTSGNAAGNVDDLFDLRGEPAPPAPLPAGFTLKGIIALVLSIFNGLLMVGMIAWYGMLQSPATEAGAGDADDGPEGEHQPLLAAESRARLEDGNIASN
jgi:iron transport multicopper oxidase